MSNNFTTAFTVDQTPEEAFAAINNVRGWWSGNPGVEGSTDKLGDVFTYRYKPYHSTTQKIEEFVPGKKVVWLVLDSELEFIEDKHEWNGTRIVFEVTRRGDKTEVRFSHVGLVPHLECFNKCSNAWSSYINGSLRRLIAKQGQPDHQETVGRTG